MAYAHILLLCCSIISSASAVIIGSFILSKCSITSHPELCYSTISPYTNSIKSNTELLAQTAISISLEKSSAAAAFVTRQKANSMAALALEDCASALKDATDQTRNALKQMKGINGEDKESVKLGISNVQTWLSAALTNQEECIDRLNEVDVDVGLKGEVVKMVEVAKKVTSNALALVAITYKYSCM